MSVNPSRVERVAVPDAAEGEIYQGSIGAALVGAATVHDPRVIAHHRASRTAGYCVALLLDEVGLDVRGELKLGGPVTWDEVAQGYEDRDGMRRQVRPAQARLRFLSGVLRRQRY